LIAAFREARPSGRAGWAHPKGGSEANEGKKTVSWSEAARGAVRTNGGEETAAAPLRAGSQPDARQPSQGKGRQA